jgi:3-oxoacyl-[acyl-carrier-protein] synthase II
MTVPGLRRVVVTGLGAVTPLGVGVRQTWKRLTASESGITSLLSLEPQSQWQGLKSTVAGLVPTGGRGVSEGKWQPSDWLSGQDQRRMPKFTQYAIAAAEEALSESGWKPTAEEDLLRTGVCLGSGLSNLDDLYTTSIDFEKDVRIRLGSDSSSAIVNASYGEPSQLT